MRKHIIFGGKGFIGQNLANRLIENEEHVLIIDIDRWRIPWAFPKLPKDQHSLFLQADINNLNSSSEEVIESFCVGSTNITVWHLAANSDILSGNDDIEIDLSDTFLTTINIIKLCGKLKLTKIYFASSSAVYGNVIERPNGFTEMCATQPISHYGAMKLASEAILRSSCEQFLENVLIFRFPNVIGYPATHGVIHDFILKLKADPSTLSVLGDGKQNKPYLHVDDLVDAMLHLDYFYGNSKGVEVLNIASCFDNVFVWQIAEAVVKNLSPMAKIVYGNTPYGWRGDMPIVNFDTTKITNTGWNCKISGIQAVEKTITENITKGIL